MVFDRPEQITFARSARPTMPRPSRVLLTTPDHYEVRYVINPHMAGNVGSVDPERARVQWEALAAAYEAIGIAVTRLPGRPGLPDMVFCANQTLPFRRPDDGQMGIVPSRMFTRERAPEVADYIRFFQSIGYRALDLPDSVTGSFEGMGDAIWHPGGYLLWGGHGIRTDRRVYDAIADHLALDVIVVTLADPDFYHLDTCFCPLDESTVLIAPEAFDETGRALVDRMFDRVLEAPADEARRGFACNAHCPDGRHALIHKGNTETCGLLSRHGFEPVEIDTSEFLKAGGSVFCMKQMYW